MDFRQWASLLDDEGVDDSFCDEEMEGLTNLRASLAAANHGSTSRDDEKDAVHFREAHSALDSAASPRDLPSARAERRAAEPCPTGAQTGREVREPAGSADNGTADPDGGVFVDGDDELSRSAGIGSGGREAMVDVVTGEPLRDLSRHAVWSVSTAKPGNGVDQLLDSSEETYWQSDGPQPHSISAQFSSKLKLSEVRLYLNLKKDESYTPAIVSVRVGSSFHDLRVIRRNKELDNPQGWVRIPLGDSSIAALNDFDDLSSLPSDEDDMDSITPGDLAERDQRRRVRADHRRRNAKKRQKDLVVGAHEGEDAAAADARSIELTRLKRRDAAFVRAHMLQIMIHTNHQNGRDSHVRQVKVLGPAQQVVGTSPQFSSVDFQMYESIR